MSFLNRLTSYLGAPFAVLMILLILALLLEYIVWSIVKVLKKCLKKRKSEVVDQNQDSFHNLKAKMGKF